MRDFAARYNVTGDYPSAVRLEKCPFEELAAALAPEEQVFFCFGALHEKVVAATNLRLLCAETRDPAHDQAGGLKAYNYDDVTSVSSMNMLLHIKFRPSQANLIFGNLAIEHIREAAELLGDIVRTYQASHLSGDTIQ